MTFSTYAELNQKMIGHFQQGEFQQALELIEKEGASFPANRPLVDYWKMVSCARLDDRKRVIEIAENCLKDGVWFGEMMWRRSPSFASLHGDADFERIVASSLALQEKDSPPSEPVVIKHFPTDYSKKSPLLIALHGNQNTAEGTLPFWRASVDSGFLLAVPQSSQAMFKGAFIWDDLEVSFRDVKACYESLMSEMDFDEQNIVLAGHSMGGLIAIQMALTGEMPVHGLVVNGPALPFGDEPEELDRLLPSARERGLRIYFVVGEKDTDIEQDEIRAFAEKIKSAEIPCELETVPAQTHDYNFAYDVPLQRALEFVKA